jgi:hypothetical protein
VPEAISLRGEPGRIVDRNWWGNWRELDRKARGQVALENQPHRIATQMVPVRRSLVVVGLQTRKRPGPERSPIFSNQPTKLPGHRASRRRTIFLSRRFHRTRNPRQHCAPRDAAQRTVDRGQGTAAINTTGSSWRMHRVAMVSRPQGRQSLGLNEVVRYDVRRIARVSGCSLSPVPDP